MIIHTFILYCIYTGISKLYVTSVLFCVRFGLLCFANECSFLVISLFSSPLCLLMLFFKMCVCFTY